MGDKLISNIKERVLMIAENRGINKAEFFSDLGLSYANFKGIQKQSALSSDALAMILSKYKEINPAWLIVGEGEMLRNTPLMAEREETYLSAELEGVSNAVIDSMQRVIASQEITIRSQEKTISSLEKQIAFLEREEKI